MSTRTHPICPECQSEDVVVDAHAGWNKDSQRYELVTEYDGPWDCRGCGSKDIEPEWIESPPAEPEEPKTIRVMVDITGGAVQGHVNDPLPQGYALDLLVLDCDDDCGDDDTARSIMDGRRQWWEIEHQKPLRPYEITIKGYDGGTDETDDLILWALAESRGAVETGLGEALRLVQSVAHLPDSYLTDHRDWDAILPEDDESLQLKITRLYNEHNKETNQ